MSGPKPGQIRCPTCHRSTPAIENCTRCGSPIPPGARARPRGLDRDELQARIRARRSGQPYRRGSVPADVPVTGPPPGPEEPWTQDAWAEYEDREAVAAAPPPDQETFAARPAQSFDQPAAGPAAWDEPPQPRWEPPAEVVSPARQPPRYVDDPTVRGPAYGPASDAAYGEQPSWEPLPYDQSAATDVRYRVRDDQDERRRGSGGAPFAILGFLALGALALFAGATIAGVLGPNRDGNLAVVPSAAPTPSLALQTAVPSTAPAVTEAPEATDDAATATPFVFPDGFSAVAEPCLGEPVSGPGGLGVCPAEGDVVSPSDRTVWVLVTFQSSKLGDQIVARGTGPGDVSIGDASWVNTSGPGQGWAYFGFDVGPLREGTYEVEVTRNNEPAAVTEFRVEE